MSSAGYRRRSRAGTVDGAGGFSTGSLGVLGMAMINIGLMFVFRKTT